MKKISFLIILFNSIFIFSQTTAVIESYNSSLKHAHLKGFINMKLNYVEDLNYDIKPYIDSLFIEKSITYKKLTNIDFKIFENFSPKYGNGKIEKYLSQLCDEGNFDSVIIIKAFGDKNNKYNILASDLSPDLDFGIVSFENPKNKIMYYNNIIFLYYSKKEGKLKYPISGKKENLFYDLNPIKFEDVVFDASTKNLIDANTKKNSFLIDLKNRLKLNFNKMIESLKD